MTEKFKVIYRSESGHCCFEATVVYADQPETIVCECFETEDAEMIVAALNWSHR